MALGYARYLLRSITEAVGGATPHLKVDARGLTKMLYTGKGSSPIRNTEPDGGNKREIRYWFRERNTKAQVDTSYTCDNVLTPARKEMTLTASNVVQIGYHLPYDLITNYDKEMTASASLAGKPATKELLDVMAGGCNAILEKMNEVLVAAITYGKNSVTGASTAQSINFPQASTTQILNNGMAKVISDYKRNGLTGIPNFICGPGLPFQYATYAALMSQAAQNGFDNRLATSWGDWYMDQDVTADEFVAFEPGSIQIVEYLENLFKPGRLANSDFFTATLPVLDPLGNSVAVPFDMQLKEIDCPTTLTDAYTGSTATYNRGHSLIIWKNFGLFQIPSDAYRAEDQQFLSNGSLRFTATNS